MTTFKRIAKSTATFWVGSSATFLALGITTVPLLPHQWQLGGSVAIAALALTGMLRDSLLQRDRKALESSANQPSDKWKQKFDTLNDFHCAQMTEVTRLEQAWVAAEEEWNSLGDFSYNKNRRAILRQRADAALEDWETERGRCKATRVELDKIAKDLENLTGYLVTVKKSFPSADA